MATYFSFVNNIFQRLVAIASSSGVADADKIVATSGTGTIHPSLQGTGYSSVPAGMEGYYFASASGAYADRSTITLPEKTSVTAPLADQIKLYAADESGFPALNYLIANGFQFRIGSDSYRFVRNSSGGILTKGTIVYITGSFAGTGIIPTVGKACAAYQATALTVPAIGACAFDIANNSVGIILTTGKLEGIDTASSGIAEGSVALLGMVPGTFQATAPALPNETQRVGIVLKSHASNGVLLVDPRTVITRSMGTNKNTFSVGDALNSTKSLIFLGNYKTTVTSSPTADRVIAQPDASGTYALTNSNPLLTVNTAAGVVAPIIFQTGAVDRWRVVKGNAAETGSNAGSNFGINRYDDAGTFIDQPLQIVRSTGSVNMINATIGTALISGTIQTTGVGSGSVSGNARGTGAVDLQSLRSSATQVASGNYSFVVGQNNTAAGVSSVAIGHTNNCNSIAVASIATGYQSVSRRSGEQVHASGQIAAAGDAQTSALVLRGSTTDATLTEILKASAIGDQRIVLQNDSTIAFSITIAARRTDADNESAAWIVRGVIDRNATAASTALVGTTTTTLLAKDSAAWDVLVDADTTNGSLRIRVQGEASKTVYWVARVELTEVIG
ncbi:MAG TPA: hypothetical protein V6D10_07125 [Trichocoleus sp.]|jgi:hypothetical protein